MWIAVWMYMVTKKCLKWFHYFRKVKLFVEIITWDLSAEFHFRLYDLLKTHYPWTSKSKLFQYWNSVLLSYLMKKLLINWLHSPFIRRHQSENLMTFSSLLVCVSDSCVNLIVAAGCQLFRSYSPSLLLCLEISSTFLSWIIFDYLWLTPTNKTVQTIDPKVVMLSKWC